MDKAPVEDIVDTLADALREIRQDNGYSTDLGAAVNTEWSENSAKALRCTVVAREKSRTEGGQNRPATGRFVRGVIAIEVPVTMEHSQQMIYRAEQDVDRCLSKYFQMPQALPVIYEESIFMEQPEGAPVRVAEIVWSTGYRRREDD